MISVWHVFIVLYKYEYAHTGITIVVRDDTRPRGEIPWKLCLETVRSFDWFQYQATASWRRALEEISENIVLWCIRLWDATVKIYCWGKKIMSKYSYNYFSPGSLFLFGIVTIINFTIMALLPIEISNTSHRGTGGRRVGLILSRAWIIPGGSRMTRAYLLQSMFLWRSVP